MAGMAWQHCGWFCDGSDGAKQLSDLSCAGALFKGARGKCGMPRTPTHTFSMHGGAGAILSVGLLRQIPRAWFEDCVTTTYTTGGDAMISICLWQVCPLISLDPSNLQESRSACERLLVLRMEGAVKVSGLPAACSRSLYDYNADTEA